ncbi:MAG: GNAT family N-acetyltransferase [Chloroflexota bacterium]|nr:MAG: GNAT family N-acetyltransferase [Chloroflexota bacterium]
MEIRKATASDEQPIIDLLNQFPPSDQMTSDSAAISNTFRQIIQNSELGSILVAEENADIIGVIALSYPVALHCGGLYACIEDFIVSEQARGKGVGGALVKAAIDEATRKGCYEIQVNNPSDLGYPVYMRCGLTSTGRHLRMKLKQ